MSLAFAPVVDDFLLARLMLAGPLASEAHERRLTQLRRNALFGAASTETLAHLAIQSFLNEFAWWAEDDELAWVEALAGRDDPESLLRVACYRPLTRAVEGAPLELNAVVNIHVRETDAARRFTAEVPAITPIEAGVSQSVREMYEQHPYPRWSMAGRLEQDPSPLGEILVAGCGTGQHSIRTAMKHPAAQVLAVDLSRASLGYATLKARQEGVGNVRHAQADLLNLSSLGRTFDQVESVGTLPCMADPAQGLAVLVAMMKPGAKLRLGLYSQAAREPLKPARELAEKYPRTDDGIRAFRRVVMNASPGDPVRAALEWPDFYSTSMCRNMLMHVVEHRHTIEDIIDLLGRHDLTFDRFDLPAPVLTRFRAEHDDERDLAQWAEFERRHPHTFRSMYQLWATAPAGAAAG
jgi:SAM-dependent methyltransferase